MLCCLCGTETNTPAANPYWWQFLVALVYLGTSAVLWSRVRPTPRPILRFLAGAAAVLAFAISVYEVSFAVGNESQLCRLVFEACVFMASMLLAEVAYTLRHPRSIARALRRRGSRRGRAAIAVRTARPHERKA